MMNKLEEREDGKYINRRKKFSPMGAFKEETIEKVFDFAYDMTYGKQGEHRSYRSGGTHHRDEGEIFANTFQGKLSECAFYNSSYKELPLDAPNFSVWSLGKWDDVDFQVNNYSLNIKSTKSFGNLLLLETKDWDNDAQYIPNIKQGTSNYDYFILVRMKPYCEDIVSENEKLLKRQMTKEELKDLVIKEKWEYDIPGWCSREELVQVIQDSHIIKKGEKLNGKVVMDADNYYIQVGDMHPLNGLIPLIKI